MVSEAPPHEPNHYAWPADGLQFTVGSDAWRMYVHAAIRVGEELFVHAALFGPWTCTTVVHVTAARGHRHAARTVLSLVREWLATGDRRDHVFLEGIPGSPVTC